MSKKKIKGPESMVSKMTDTDMEVATEIGQLIAKDSQTQVENHQSQPSSSDVALLDINDFSDLKYKPV